MPKKYVADEVLGIERLNRTDAATKPPQMILHIYSQPILR
jgi:hypothetical protein